jgi:alpha-L-fucosidase
MEVLLMKPVWVFLLVIATGCGGAVMVESEDASSAASVSVVTPDWESLDARPTPEWWRDAKFGVFVHWGVYSVPAYSEGWYAEWYYFLLNRQKPTRGVPKHHAETYGEDFTYPQFAPRFKAESFDPESWARLFEEAGARYVVLTSKHHDGFCLWDAPDTKGWNAVEVGPKRDLIDPLAKAVRARGLKFGLYYSLMEWDFGDELPGNKYPGGGEEYVSDHVMPQMKDLVSRYQPSIMWADGEGKRGTDRWRSEEFLAWYVNNSANGDQVTWNDRWGKGKRGKHGNFFSTEYGKYGKEGGARAWEETRGIGGSFGYNSWYEDKDERYPKSQELIDILVSTISRGGNLLLNIGPKADGTIIDVFKNRLRDIGRFLKVNGEAVYGSRLPRVSKQGDDVMFTRHKDNRTLYAFVKNKPGNSITLNGVFARPSSEVVLLADPAKRPLTWRVEDGNLVIEDIDQVSRFGEYYWVFRIPGGFDADPSKVAE